MLSHPVEGQQSELKQAGHEEVPKLQTQLSELKQASHEKALSPLHEQLQERIKFIQQSYEKVWNSFNNEVNQAVILYRTESYTHIDAILSKFDQYRSAAEIERDFKELRGIWRHHAKEKRFDDKARGAYLLSLSAMEAAFLDVFAAKLKGSIQPPPDIKTFLPVKPLVEIDSKNIVSGIVNEYKQGLSKRIFAKKHKEKFNDELSIISDFGKQKELFYVEFSKFEIKSIVENKQSNDVEKCRFMVVEEVKDAALLAEHKKLLAKRSELVLLGAQTLGNSMQHVDQYMLSSKHEGETLYPEIDSKKIPDLAKLSDQIAEQVSGLEKSIALISKQNEVRTSYSEARNALRTLVLTGDQNEYKDGFKQRVLKAIDNQGWFFRNKQVEETCAYLKKVLDDVEKNDLDKKDSDESLIGFSLLKNKIDELKQKLSASIAELQGLLKIEAISVLNQVIKRKRERLTNQLAVVCNDVKPVPNISIVLESRARQQNEFWESLVITDRNIKEFEKLKEEFLTKAKQNNNEQSIIYGNRVAILVQKLKDYQSRNEMAAIESKLQVMPLQADDGQFRRPRPLSPIQEETKEERVGAMSMAIAMPPATEKNFFQKSWVKAVGIGLLCCFVVAAICSVYGIVVALPAMSILISAVTGGGVSFIAAGVASYYIVEKVTQVEKPRLQANQDASSENRASLEVNRSSTASLPFQPGPSVVSAQSQTDNANESQNCFSRLFARISNTRSDNDEHTTNLRFQK